MAKVSEKIETKKVTDIELLTETVAALTLTVQTQNDIILCLLHKFELNHDLPLWTTKEAMEKDVGPKVKACVESVRRLYGHSKTDKS